MVRRRVLSHLQMEGKFIAQKEKLRRFAGTVWRGWWGKAKGHLYKADRRGGLTYYQQLTNTSYNEEFAKKKQEVSDFIQNSNPESTEEFFKNNSDQLWKDIWECSNNAYKWFLNGAPLGNVNVFPLLSKVQLLRLEFLTLLLCIYLVCGTPINASPPSTSIMAGLHCALFCYISPWTKIPILHVLKLSTLTGNSMDNTQVCMKLIRSHLSASCFGFLCTENWVLTITTNILSLLSQCCPTGGSQDIFSPLPPTFMSECLVFLHQIMQNPL